MKSENYETWWGVKLSHEEPMIKIWKILEQVVMSDVQNPQISACVHMRSHVVVFGFWTFDVATSLKLSRTFIIGFTCDNMTPRQVS